MCAHASGEIDASGGPAELAVPKLAAIVTPHVNLRNPKILCDSAEAGSQAGRRTTILFCLTQSESREVRERAESLQDFVSFAPSYCKLCCTDFAFSASSILNFQMPVCGDLLLE